MYELKKAGDRTYYIDCPTKIGIYLLGNDQVCLIDSGNNKDTGRKVSKICQEQGWEITCIINTHSNADHIGGNHILQNRTGCRILSTSSEAAFINNPVFEPAFLYGGFPCKDLRNRFLLAETSTCDIISSSNLPSGLEPVSLKGHFFDMIGIRTSDNVVFLADCVFSEETIRKYHVFFLYDVAEFLSTLTTLESIQANLFIPSHAPVSEELSLLIQLNREKVQEIISQILHLCQSPVIFEDILQGIFQHYSLTMDFNQYVLVGSTVRSYLSFLCDEKKLGYTFIDGKMYWQTL